MIEEKLFPLFVQGNPRENVNRNKVLETRDGKLKSRVHQCKFSHIYIVLLPENESVKLEAEESSPRGEEYHSRNAKLGGYIDHGGAEYVDDKSNESWRVGLVVEFGDGVSDIVFLVFNARG